MARWFAPPDGGYVPKAGGKRGTPPKIPAVAPAPTEQWGLRYMNFDNESVYISQDGKESALRAMAPGDVLVHRYVTEWEPV